MKSQFQPHTIFAGENLSELTCHLVLRLRGGPGPEPQFPTEFVGYPRHPTGVDKDRYVLSRSMTKPTK